MRELDALRGVAALVVVLCHWLNAQAWWADPTGPVHALQRTPLRLLVAGPEAVLLFFVLSGLVLSRGPATAGPYPAFVIRRAARLLPPAWAALAFGLVLALLVGHGEDPVLTPTLQDASAGPVATATVLAHADLVRGDLMLLRIDSPVWTLIHEARIALLFPLLLLLSRRVRPVLALGSAAAVAMIGIGSVDGFPGITWTHTVAYAGCFVVGIVLGDHADRVGAALRAAGPRRRTAAWAAAVLLVTTPYTVGLDHTAFVTGGASVVVATIGAAGLIALAQTPGATRVLCRRVPLWLGDVSYSLYLWHFPVLIALVRVAAPTVPTELLALPGIAVALLLAAASRRWIERPAARLGARAAAALVARRVTPAVGAAQVARPASAR